MAQETRNQRSVGMDNVFLSGWATRSFTLEEFSTYLSLHKPTIIELSKYFCEGDVSIKKLYRLLREYRQEHSCTVSYAGTTDFIRQAGLDTKTYLDYLMIQAAQAAFLECDYFRILVGGDLQSTQEVIPLLNQFQEKLGACRLLIEVHAGWESNPSNLQQLIDTTDYQFVLDFQNALKAGLKAEMLIDMLPAKRIAYIHNRNILTSPRYIECENCLAEEQVWQESITDIVCLWEPKKMQSDQIARYVLQ